MSYRLIRHLQSVRVEYEAARAALAFAQQQWPAAHGHPALSGTTFAAFQIAVRNIEATYTLRIFAEFEAILRVQYPHSRPGDRLPNNSDALINRLGRRYRIPSEHRDRAHRVRRFRHSIAHAATPGELVPLVDALSWLNWYLSFIPDEDVP